MLYQGMRTVLNSPREKGASNSFVTITIRNKKGVTMNEVINATEAVDLAKQPLTVTVTQTPPKKEGEAVQSEADVAGGPVSQ